MFSLCFLLCIFSLFFSVFFLFSVCCLSVCSRCVLSVLSVFLIRLAFHRTAKNDTFLSLNIGFILQCQNLLISLHINTIKGWWLATSQLLWLQYRYHTLTVCFELSEDPASSCFFFNLWLDKFRAKHLSVSEANVKKTLRPYITF